MISISVIVTCFSEGNLLNRALNSLKEQTLKEFETIIVNDSSDDELTNRICKEIKESGVAVYRTSENMGPSGARNLGISMAKGELIIPLDADDTLPPDSVENVLTYLNKHPECDFLYGNYKRIDLPENTSELIDCSQITDNNELNPVKLLNNWILLGMTPHRKSIWQKLGGYSMRYSYTCQDVDFQIRAFMNDAKYHFLNKTIYNWYRSPLGVNSSEKNNIALTQCWYDNFEFIIYFSKDYKEGFNLALDNNDYKKLKHWANYEAGKKNLTQLVLIFHMSPGFLYPLIVPLYKGIKFIKRRIGKQKLL